MSRPDRPKKRAVALQYGPDDPAPVVVASGMGYLAERIVETAQENGVPVYEDDSLATILSQLNLGQQIPEELYQAIVEIYVYFLNFDASKRERRAGDRTQAQATPEPEPEPKPEPESESGSGDS